MKETLCNAPIFCAYGFAIQPVIFSMHTHANPFISHNELLSVHVLMFNINLDNSNAPIPESWRECRSFGRRLIQMVHEAHSPAKSRWISEHNLLRLLERHLG